MPKAEDKIPDPRDDFIGKLLTQFSSLPSTSSGKIRWALKTELRQALLGDGYLQFDSYSSAYHLSCVGESCLYDLSPRHNGKLREFAGKRVRVVCTGSGPRWQRKFMAKPVTQ